MAGQTSSTYSFISSQKLGSAVSSVTFNNIPQGYTDLVLVCYAICSASATNDIGITFNGDTGANYSRTYLYGNGSSASSGRNSNVNVGYEVFFSQYGVQSTVNIMNYSNANTYKTFLIRTGQASDSAGAAVDLWRNTSAITSVTLTAMAYQIAAGSTFSLYGIKAADVGPVVPTKATGGDVIASDGVYTYHAFKSTGSFIPATSLTADILVVAGGGGAGRGGGGAGGLIGFSSQSLTAGTAYNCVIGAGGYGGIQASGQTGVNGSNSSFEGLTAAVGGGAGSGSFAANSGGSGGGGGTALGTGTSGQGNSGGTSYNYYPNDAGGGGGGAGGIGANQNGSGVGGAGGVGATYNTTVGGSAGPYAFIDPMGAATNTGQLVSGHYYFAGGGGAGGRQGDGAGGYGGGATAYFSGETTPNAATNTGGGGGGTAGLRAGGGGSGIVIVRYLS